MTITTATRRLEWDSAHRVLRHESKCATLHGHRYAAELECWARAGMDDVGRVIDFGKVKEIVGSWIDESWDHTTLVNQHDRALFAFTHDEAKTLGKRAPYVMRGEPTAENIAAELLEVASQLLDPYFIDVVRVRVWETPNCYAEVRR